MPTKPGNFKRPLIAAAHGNLMFKKTLIAKVIAESRLSFAHGGRAAGGGAPVQRLAAVGHAT